jgi:hypothetical protein
MARITDAQARDLDETRRLLYMALLCKGTKKYNLAGTIVNAIKHHQGVDIDPDASDGVASQALIDKVVEYVNGEAPEGDTWVLDQVLRCIKTLDE